MKLRVKAFRILLLVFYTWHAHITQWFNEVFYIAPENSRRGLPQATQAQRVRSRENKVILRDAVFSGLNAGFV